MTLRDELVQELYPFMDGDYNPDEWAEQALDAVLNKLHQNTEKWANLYPITKRGLRGQVGRNIVADVLPKAIAVLLGPNR